MEQLQGKVHARLADPEEAAKWKAATGGTPEECPPIYSFDNPSIHIKNPTYLAQLGLVEADTGEPTATWLQLPPYSGDLHRTIERVHARVCGKFQRWVNVDSSARTMEFYCRTLVGLFLTQTPEIISSCMASIHKLYQKVVELKGDKAPRPFC